MDAREKMKMRHTVTAGMSGQEISKQKALESLWREMKLIGLTVKNELASKKEIQGTKR